MLKIIAVGAMALGLAFTANTAAQAGQHCERSVLQAQNDQIDDTSNVITPNISGRELEAARANRVSPDEAACLAAVQRQQPPSSF